MMTSDPPHAIDGVPMASKSLNQSPSVEIPQLCKAALAAVGKRSQVSSSDSEREKCVWKCIQDHHEDHNVHRTCHVRGHKAKAHLCGSNDPINLGKADASNSALSRQGRLHPKCTNH
eukprot:4519272-Amphidinium_carterae.1